jgi:hypothetical protein
MIDQISVFVENKTGKLAEITGILGAAGEDIRAMSIADTTDFGILRLIVDKPEKALEVLQEAECIVTVNQVIAVSIDDKPGSLSKVLQLLFDGGISIEYLYAFITRKKENAYVILRMEDNEKAAQILSEHQIKIARQEELFDL